jgi:sulfite reductase (ferredoxin)
MAEGQNANFGRKLRGLKTSVAELPFFTERLASRYLAGRKDAEEPFAEWVQRVDEEELR